MFFKHGSPTCLESQWILPFRTSFWLGVDVSENPAWQQRRVGVSAAFGAKNRRLFGRIPLGNTQPTNSTDLRAKLLETSQVIENPTCLHWPDLLPACCMSSTTPTAESGKWSDTNFPVLTGANRPGFGSTRFKICIHYSISTDLVQKTTKKILAVLVMRCWSW